MLSFEIYKLVHLFGIFLVFISSGALIYHAALGQGKTHPMRKTAFLSHGVGLFFILLGGFGMLARLGIVSSMPLWVIIKIIIWLLVGGGLALFYRKPQLARIYWWVLVLLGLFAAYLGLWKPY